MTNTMWNSSLTIAILVGVALAVLAGSAAIQANANAVLAALVAIITALIGIGGTLAIGEWRRRAEVAEEKRRVRSSFYQEIAGYLNQGMNPHMFLAQAYKSGSITPDTNTQVMLRGALNMPDPVYFPSNFDKLALLDNPHAVKGFYNCLDVVRRQRGRPGMEGIFDVPKYRPNIPYYFASRRYAKDRG